MHSRLPGRRLDRNLRAGQGVEDGYAVGVIYTEGLSFFSHQQGHIIESITNIILFILFQAFEKRD
jgi:hypothetical protein